MNIEGFSEKSVLINEKRINYIDEGRGNPIIFLHNGGGFWQVWEHQLRAFSETNRVIALDWPAFGESEALNGPITLPKLTQTLRSFLLELKLETFALVGNCIGASVAIAYKQMFSEEVKALVLFHPCPGKYLFPVGIRGMIRSISSNAFSRWLCAPLFIAGFNHSPAKRHFPGILFGLKKPSDSRLFKKYIQKLGETKQTKARLQLLYGVSSFTLTKELADNFTSDHILIWAEENAFMNWERQGLVQKELLRTKNSFKIPHSGHLCMYEEPEQVNRIIADYLITRKW